MEMNEVIGQIQGTASAHDSMAFIDILIWMAAPSHKIVCHRQSIQPLLDVIYSAVDQFSAPRDGEHKDLTDRNAGIPELAKKVVLSLPTKVTDANPHDIHSQVQSFLSSRSRARNSSVDSSKRTVQSVLEGVSAPNGMVPGFFSPGWGKGFQEFQRMPNIKSMPGMKK